MTPIIQDGYAEPPTRAELAEALAATEAALPRAEAALAAAEAKVESCRRAYDAAGRARALGALGRIPQRPGEPERFAEERRRAEGAFEQADTDLLAALSARAPLSARRDALRQQCRRLRAQLGE